MTTTSTHDSKRGEDASARIAVLSEMPEAWRRAVRAFDSLAEGARSAKEESAAPSRSLEYLFYQTLVGAWPPGWDGRQGRGELIVRMGAFLHKASREAKQETSWTSPNPDYDAAVEAFVVGVMRNDSFMEEMSRLCGAIAPHGASNGLALALLRSCSPGIPDIYQGSELWNQSLVDPDNRRPVDFEARQQALSALIRQRSEGAAPLCRRLLENYASGEIKLYVTHTALMARRRSPELFLRGDYEPLPGSDHVVAFARSFASARLVCAVTRRSYSKMGGRPAFATGSAWEDEQLRIPHAGLYRDLLTDQQLNVGRELRLADVFRDLPVALLWQEIGSQR
jgi:(1->4)-alpha-D-glucan 1-alpha-D-glucosylmutase